MRYKEIHCPYGCGIRTTYPYELREDNYTLDRVVKCFGCKRDYILTLKTKVETTSSVRKIVGE